MIETSWDCRHCGADLRTVVITEDCRRTVRSRTVWNSEKQRFITLYQIDLSIEADCDEPRCSVCGKLLSIEQVEAVYQTEEQR